MATSTIKNMNPTVNGVMLTGNKTPYDLGIATTTSSASVTGKSVNTGTDTFIKDLALPSAGYWYFKVIVIYPSGNATGSRYAGIRYYNNSGTGYVRSTNVKASDTARQTIAYFTWFEKIYDAYKTVSIVAFQNSGSSISNVEGYLYALKLR